MRRRVPGRWRCHRPPCPFWRGFPVRPNALGSDPAESTARYAHLTRSALHDGAERVANSLVNDVLQGEYSLARSHARTEPGWILESGKHRLEPG